MLATMRGGRRGRFGGIGIPGETGPSGVPGRIEIVANTTQLPPNGVSLGSGETFNLDALAYDSGDGSLMTGLTVTWSSSDSGVVTVDSTGLVSYVANGTATITASVNSAGGNPITDVEAVTATGPAAVASVTNSVSSLSGVAGTAWSFTAQPKDAGGNNLSGRTVTAASTSNAISGVPNVSGYTISGTFASAGTATITATCETIDGAGVGVTVTASGGGSLSPNKPATITTYRERFWNANNESGAPGNVGTEGGWYDSTAHTWPQVVATNDATLVADMTSGQVAALYQGSAGNVGKSQFTGSGDGTSPTLSSFQNGVSGAGFNSDEVYASLMFAPSLNWDHITSFKLFQFSTHTPGTNANSRVGIVVHLRANQSSKFGDTATPLTLDLVISVNSAGGTTEVRATAGTITRGSANHVEIYCKLNTNGSLDGICKMWFNGASVMDRPNLGYRGGSATILGGDQFYLVNLYSSKGGPTTSDTIAAPCRLYYGYLGLGFA